MQSNLILKSADILRLQISLLHRLAFKAILEIDTSSLIPLAVGNLDGGFAASIYGGVSPIDGGGA